MFADLIERLVGLSDWEQVENLRALELQRRALDAEMAAAIAVADQHGVSAGDGHRSMTAMLRAELNWSTSDAARFSSISRAVDQIPGLGDAWATGKFGQSQVREIAKVHGNRRVRDELHRVAPLVLDHAETLPHSDFVMTLTHFVQLADQEGAHKDRDENIEHRNANVVDVGGSLNVRAHGGTGLISDEMISIFDRFCHAEYEADVAARLAEHASDAENHPLPRSAGQRRFDAFVSVFRTANGAADVGAPPAFVVNITTDAATFGRMLRDAGLTPRTSLDGVPVDPFTGLERPVDLIAEMLDAPGGLTRLRCETSNGVPLHTHDVLRAALAGHVRRSIIDARGVTINHGRKQRLFTGPAREAAKLLIRHCEHPGCELPVDWCEVDHMVEWIDKGETVQSNGGIECRGHNLEKHRRKWRTERADNGRSYTFREDGTIMLPVGAREPEFDELLDDPDEMARTTQLARARLRAALARDAA